MKILVTKFHPTAIIPTYAVEGDAGADLYARSSIVVPARGSVLIDTGIGVSIPEGYFGLIRGRSSLATKRNIAANSSGVIDSGYRGPIKVQLTNNGDDDYLIGAEDRIAQILILPVLHANYIEVPTLPNSIRGVGGHGSTGI